MNPNDPTADLREKLLALTYGCPKAGYTKDCPFGVLAGLSHGSREAVLARMSRDELLKLFELPATCACPADPRK